MNRSFFTGMLAASVALGGATPGGASPSVPGYGLGRPDLPAAPITLEELELLKGALLFGDDDVRYLRMSQAVLEGQVEEVLDVWYGFVASTPQLVVYFADASTGEPDGQYLAAVRKRFGRWILDTAAADYDQAWLDYQFEIGRRHHRTGKNRTDGVSSAPIIHFRYLAALHFPITATLRPFLAKGGHGPETVERMLEAWRKSVLLQVILWSHSYVRDGDF